MDEIFEWLKEYQIVTDIYDWFSANYVMLWVLGFGLAISEWFSKRAGSKSTKGGRWIDLDLESDGHDMSQIEVSARQSSQDIDGVMHMLHVTNMILGGILAVLIYFALK